MPRLLTILVRWLTIFAYAVIAVIFGYILARQFPSPLSQAEIERIPEWLVTMVASLVLLAPYCCLTIRFSHLRTLLFYPPVWVAGILATAGLLILDRNLVTLYEFPVPFGLWALAFEVQVGAITVCGVFRASVGCIDWQLTAKKHDTPGVAKAGSASSRSQPVGKEAEDGPPETKRWQEWIQSESPASSPHDDRFGFAPIAHDIAHKLIAPFGCDTTIGLIGSYGCGKSSIIRFVEYYLDHDRKNPRRYQKTVEVYLCPVDCWGLEDAGTAIEYILAKAVDKISTLADCTRLNGLPGDYHQLIGMEKNTAFSFANFLFGNPEPLARLSGLSHILRSINVRLVLAIENLDRPRGGRFEPQEILALLARLKDGVPGMSYILTGSVSAHFDFSKLCDFRFDVPRIEPGLLLDLWESCIDSCKANPWRYPNERLMPHLDQSDFALFRRRSFHPRHTTEVLEQASKPNRPGDWIALLPWTPRVLKLMLRHVEMKWATLKGEVNFTDLFIVQGLRFAAPEAYDFLAEHIDFIRTYERDKDDELTPAAKNGYPPEAFGLMPSQPRASRFEKLRCQWQKISNGAAWSPEIVARLIVYVLPRSYPLFELGDFVPSRRRNVQGIRFYAPTDYWRRVVTGRVKNNPFWDREVLDQQVLDDIKKWDEGTTTNFELVEGLLGTEEYRHTVMRLMTDSDIQRPLKLADKLISTYKNSRRPGYSPATIGGRGALEDLVLALSIAFKDARDTYYDYVATKDESKYPLEWWHATIRDLISEKRLVLCTVLWAERFFLPCGEHTRKIRDTMREKFVLHFPAAKTSDWLGDLLKEQGVSVLADFFFYRGDGETYYPSPDTWHDYAQPILEIATFNPSEYLVPLLLLVFEFPERSERHRRLQERPGVLDGMFRGMKEAVLELARTQYNVNSEEQNDFLAQVRVTLSYRNSLSAHEPNVSQPLE